MAKGKLILKAEVSGDELFFIIRDYVMRTRVTHKMIQAITNGPDGAFITRIEMHHDNSKLISHSRAIVELSVPRKITTGG